MTTSDSPYITITGPKESSATVYLHGAHVTSWKTEYGEERLFVSRQAIFEPPKAIRGGVPVCFPQFGTLGSLGQHGFARNSLFKVISNEKGTAVLELTPTKEHLSKFPHEFRLTVTVHVGSKSLYQELKVENTGSNAFDFTAALHTYFSVTSIQQVAVGGLKGLEYFDNVTQSDDYKKELDSAVRISGETDRIYRQAPNTLTITDSAANSQVTIEKRGFPDAVLWNPWKEKAAGMSDFADDEYQVMICLEPALAKSGPKSLDPGHVWSASQTLTYNLL